MNRSVFFPVDTLMRAFNVMRMMVESLVELSEEERWIEAKEHEGIPSDLIMHTAATEGRTEVLKHMIGEGHSVNFCASGDRTTPLHQASLHGHLDTVRVLLNAGASVNLRNYDGSTALCLGCTNGNVEIVKLLLEQGSEVNPRLNLITTPLHEAVLGDNHEIIELLLERGAQMETSDLHFGTSLHLAAYKNNAKSAIILLKAGANVNAAKMHSTALHLAANNNNTEMATVLLEFGANAWARNNWGMRASDIVSQSSKLYSLLTKFQDCPPKLMALCRNRVRSAMTVHRLSHITDLQLPSFLIGYLRFDEVEV